jgi:hypothetical protein
VLVGLLKFQRHFGHDSHEDGCGVAFVPKLICGFGQPDLELISFFGQFTEGIGYERLSSYLSPVVVDQVSVVAVDDVSTQAGLDDQFGNREIRRP